MKIEVTNSPAELDELVNRGTELKEFLVNLVTGRENPKKDPNAAVLSLEVLETYLDMLQIIGILKIDVNRALNHLQYQPEHEHEINP